MRIFSTLTIFTVNFFLILFLLSFINVYNYSSSFFEKQYTSYGNRIFNQNNPTINDLFKNMFDKTNYDDENTYSFHWVSNENFTKEQEENIYFEITLNNFDTITNWYNTYLAPRTVKTISDHPETIKPHISEESYQLLLQMIPIWKNNNIYPYLTNGFKLYNPVNSLVSTSNLSAKWNKNGNDGPNYFHFEGYQNNQFPKWIYLQGENTNQALDLIQQENSNYLNAILPLGMAKQLNVEVGDTISSQISVDYSDDQPWATIPIHVVGINNYNYLDNNLIVNQQLLFNFILNKYSIINPTVKININNYESFLNSMLVKDSTPEIAHNISFYNYNRDYSDFQNLQLNGDFKYYTAVKYSDINININQYIDNLIKGLETLITIVLFITAIVILILIYLVFSENKNNIISLKFLGYNNFKITNFLLVPYIIGFIIFTLTITAIVYLTLVPFLNLLFSATSVVLLFNFSWILWLILIISITFLILIAFITRFIQIMKSKISDLELLE